jgi:hypothetical protein
MPYESRDQSPSLPKPHPTNEETIMDINMESAEPKKRKSTAIIPFNVPVVILPEMSLQGLADQITEASGEAVEKILLIGRLFLAANKAKRHGGWGRMFKGHPQAIERPVRYSVTKAKMYMKVAQHPTLSNRNLGYDLPPSLSALYQLTFIPEPLLSQLIAEGIITPDITKAGAIALRLVVASPLLFRMELPQKHLKPGQIRKQPINRQRSCTALINSLLIDQAQLARYTTMVSEQILSGVVWIPPFTQPWPIKAKPIKTKHTCECGHRHEDQR